MQLENYPLAINLLVAFTSLFPLIVMLYLYKAMPPKYYGLLMWGVILVVWSAFNLGWMSEAITLLNNSNVSASAEKSVKRTVLANLQIWVYLVPAVTAAIGANLITEYLTRNKPNNA